MNGLLVRVYPANLSDADLQNLVEWALLCADMAPTFAAWMSEKASAEQMRRLRMAKGQPEIVEVEAFVLPVQEWSNQELAEALQAVTVLTYTVRRPAAGEVCDQVCRAIVAAAASRLKRVYR